MIRPPMQSHAGSAATSYLAVVGAGLAGCEAAWQAARRGIDVRLYGSVYLNRKLAREKNLDEAEVEGVEPPSALRNIPHVARVYTRQQLIDGNVAPDAAGRAANYGFYGPRSGDLFVFLDAYWFVGDNSRATRWYGFQLRHARAGHFYGAWHPPGQVQSQNCSERYRTDAGHDFWRLRSQAARSAIS